MGIESYTYGVKDLDASIRFHQDLGLEVLHEGDRGADFQLLDGARVMIRPADDESLPPANINWLHMNHSTLHEVVWAVDTKASLDALGAELSTDRKVETDGEGVLHTVDPLGNGMGFAISTLDAPQADQPQFNTVKNLGRIDRRAKGAQRNRTHPYRFSHMVYWVPNPSPGAVDFYTQRLGFRITDLPSAGTFMQCDGCTDHHNLFLQRSDDFIGFQHVSYEVADFDELMMLGTLMENQGWKTNVGPLRHNIGSSLSWYMWNPAGGVMEILCDLDQTGNDWEVREFDGSDPSFYGHAWVARPEHEHIKPAQWIGD